MLRMLYSNLLFDENIFFPYLENERGDNNTFQLTLCSSRRHQIKTDYNCLNNEIHENQDKIPSELTQIE